jgi:NCS1 family nucleobase:cation symporter-1
MLLITIAPVAIVGTVIPDLFFANFGTFLSFLGVAFAPLCGIQIVHYFFFGGSKLSLSAVFSDDSCGPYQYSGGFSLAAIIAMCCGCGTYMALLNPLTFASSAPFKYLTASIPAMFVAGLVYFGLRATSVSYRRLGLGRQVAPGTETTR